MPPPPIIVAVHGILTARTTADWPQRFAAWCSLGRVNAKVITKEYGAGPFPLWNLLWKNPRISRGLAREVELYFHTGQRDPELHFVAHSNGTDIALRTIKRLAARGIRTSSFIAIGSVLQADIATNGIARLVDDGYLDRAVSYSSGSDAAIGIGRWTTYGSLGVTGWREAGEPHRSARVFTRWFNGFGHSTYFENEFAIRTFNQIKEDSCL